MTPAREHRNGLLATTLAFVIWGLFPLYWRLLIEVPSFLIIAHRVIWSAVLLIGGLAIVRGWGWLREVWATPRRFWLLGLSSLLIGANWSLYI
jgi:chloramphenicol-sensitive protein RarD